MIVYFSSRIAILLYETIRFLASYENAFLFEKLKLSKDFIEMFLCYSVILYVFRPRARWPEWYGVDLNTAKDSVFRNKQRPILVAKLTNCTVLPEDGEISTPGDNEVKNAKKKKGKLLGFEGKEVSNWTDEMFDDFMEHGADYKVKFE